MTFSIFEAAATRRGYVAPYGDGVGIRVMPEGQWRVLKASKREEYGNAARKAFVDSLRQKYGDAVADLVAPLLTENGKPLECRHVKWVLEEKIPEIMRRKRPNPDTIADFEDPTRAILAPPELNPEILIDPTTATLIQSSFAPKQFRFSEPLPPPPAERIDAMDVILAIPDAAPPPPPAPPVTGGGVPPPKDKGKEWEDAPAPSVIPQSPSRRPEAPRGRPLPRDRTRPSQSSQSEAKSLQASARAALQQSFKAIENYAVRGKDGKLLKSTEKALAFAKLFSNPPDCAALHKMILKCRNGEKTSVALHWDLPKKMNKWVDRLCKAETQQDVEQIKWEMDLHLKQLDKDIDLIEAIVKQPMGWFEQNHLNWFEQKELKEALKQLESIRDQLKSGEDSPWKSLGDHLKRIRAAKLPDEEETISRPWPAAKRLEKLGINYRDEDRASRVDLANRMTKARKLLLDNDGEWESALKIATQDEKKLLEEYQRRLMTRMSQQISNDFHGQALIEFDDTKHTYSIAGNSGDERLRVFWQLNAFSRQICGADLEQALGYQELNDQSDGEDESDPSKA